jgi:hypothetical protein
MANMDLAIVSITALGHKGCTDVQKIERVSSNVGRCEESMIVFKNNNNMK